MADKDQFTFDDDDDFPGTSLDDQNKAPESDFNDDSLEMDLSSAFSEGEFEADVPAVDEPEPQAKGGGNSKTRLLLIVLLLVLVGGAGAYYFMGLGGTTHSVPTVAVPSQKPKSVALPPQPAKAPAAQAKKPVAKPAPKPATVAVPPPARPVAKAEPVKQAAPAPKQAPKPAATTVAVPVPPPAKPAVKAEPVKQAAPAPTAKVAVAKPQPVKQPAAQVAVAVPKPTPKPVAAKPVAQKAPAAQKTAVAVPAPTPKAVAPAKTVAAPKQVAGGAYALDAGSYLMESNRNSLVAKIKKLGYEPLVTPVDATLDMTRLRVGTFGKDEVQEALAVAQEIEPGSYSSPAGDRYVIYAGTFLQAHSIEKLSKRFLEEGIKVRPEPVQVVRTLSRIRFGSFATKDDAAAAAREVAAAGLKSTVVKSK